MKHDGKRQDALITAISDRVAKGMPLTEIADDLNISFTWVSDLKQVGEKLSAPWRKAIVANKVSATACVLLTKLTKTQQNAAYRDLKPSSTKRVTQKQMYRYCCEVRGIEPRPTLASAIKHFQAMDPGQKVTVAGILEALQGT